MAREGRRAVTHYSSLAVWQRRSLTLAGMRLETGRTHQIRVHTASIGHPVAGDRVYGRGGDGFDRLFLHAAKLGFEHPINGDPIEVESPLPPGLQAELDRLGEPDEGRLPAS